MRRLRRSLELLEPRAMLSATVLEHDDVGYFFEDARVERYDIDHEAWLAPLALGDATGTPTVAHVDADGI